MLIVALTGGIAVGKSVVTKVLKELGCFIHQADTIAHQLMAPEKPAWKKIVDHFGSKILSQDNTINRFKLGAIVFSDEKERLFLNKLLHPLVFEKKKEIINKLKKEGDFKIFVSEAALTLESGYADFFDKIVVVYCKKDVQIERLMERDQISKNEAIKKIKSQMPPEEKLKFANYIIDTSSTLKSTIEHTERVFRNLMMDYEIKLKTNFC